MIWFHVYWIVGLAGALVGSFLHGMTDDNDDIGFIIAVISIFWPLVLAIAIVCSPFVGLYELGQYLNRKKNEKD